MKEEEKIEKDRVVKDLSHHQLSIHKQVFGIYRGKEREGAPK